MLIYLLMAMFFITLFPIVLNIGLFILIQILAVLTNTKGY